MKKTRCCANTSVSQPLEAWNIFHLALRMRHSSSPERAARSSASSSSSELIVSGITKPCHGSGSGSSALAPLVSASFALMPRSSPARGRCSPPPLVS